MSEVPLYLTRKIHIKLATCKRKFKLPWREAGPPNRVRYLALSDSGRLVAFTPKFDEFHQDEYL